MSSAPRLCPMWRPTFCGRLSLCLGIAADLANFQGAHPANCRICPSFKTEAQNKRAATIARTERQRGASR
ncbi:Uncharacterized protein OBRU01_20061 [Operophtera brumata]|uniref:Secreted protein n=1 Tax=Operophtera brumata TaxID=104452 RepID=A0A0L7KRN5_OPEBR|nr:Uncharacterized protein OBRU01_20061 [Operophtera brumata]